MIVRNPLCDAPLSREFGLRALTRYPRQYESLHRCEPPRSVRIGVDAVSLLTGFRTIGRPYAVASNASSVHCQTLPDMSYNPYALGGYEPTGAVEAFLVGNSAV